MLQFDHASGQFDDGLAKESSVAPSPPSASVGGSVANTAPADAVEMRAGRTLDAQQRRQQFYLSAKAEGFSADEAPGDVVVGGQVASGTALRMLSTHNTYRANFNDCDASRVPRVSLATPAPTPSQQSQKSLSVKDPKSRRGLSPSLSPLVDASLDSSDLRELMETNCLCEDQAEKKASLWWRHSDAISDEVLQDVPPDMFMEICYPQRGFYVKMSAENQERYLWNERYQAAFNLAESTERRLKMKEFVRDFSTVAVPFAMEVLANLRTVPSPLIHRHGVTVEIPALTRVVHTMFKSDVLRSHKMANLEFQGRQWATAAACPQLNVPFSLLVEFAGGKALVYPRVPLRLDDPAPTNMSPSVAAAPPLSLGVGEDDELVYGMHHPEWFHQEVFRLADAEVNAVMQRLARLLKVKGAWIGREFPEKRFVYGPMDVQVYRSATDNRIYATNLRSATPSNTLCAAGSRTSSGSAAAATINPADVLSMHDAMVAAQQLNDYKIARFRPEFVARHQKGDALSCESNSPVNKCNIERDESERMEEVNLLLSYVIPQASEQLSRDTRLNGLTWPFFRCGGLSNFLHSWGINLRFLPLVHAKLVRTRSSGLALAFVEVEMVARALKRWILTESFHKPTGAVREIDVADHLLSLLTPFTPERWTSVVWPAVLNTYPAFTFGVTQKWDVSRVDHIKVVGRLLRMMGAFLMRQDSEELVDDVDSELSDCISSSSPSPSSVSSRYRIIFFPVVKCPAYPKAPLEEGQDVHLMILAKRYLREVSFDLKFNPVSNRDMLDRYMAFLEQMGERNCEEVNGFYAAEQERKDRVLKGGKPVFAEAGKDDRTVKYRLRDNRGMRVLDISRETMERFRFFHGQQVQLTLGADAGKLSTIVGVLDGVLFHHEDDADGASELFGRNHHEIQAHYGLVLLDKLINARRYQLQQRSGAAVGHPPTVTAADVMIHRPYHHVGERGLMIFETASDVLTELFGIESGQRLMFLRGPRRGQITTVIGALDGVLYHQLDHSIQFETIRIPAATDLQREHGSTQDEGPAPKHSYDRHPDHGSSDSSTHKKPSSATPPPLLSRVPDAPVPFTPFKSDASVTIARLTLAYPMDSTVVYAESLDIFAGYRACVNLGYFYRQVVLLTKGPYAQRRGVILGAHAGTLQFLLPFRHVPVDLGTVYDEIVETHAPQILGSLSYAPTHEPPPAVVMYPGLGGELIAFDGSYAACLPLGGVRGHRVKVLSGAHAGSCGFVVGERRGKLWAQLDGETGAQPLVPGAFVVLKGSIFDEDVSTEVRADAVQSEWKRAVFPHRDASGLPKSQARELSFPFLAEFGEVVVFDASPEACRSFGYYHSQRLCLQRRPRRSDDVPLSADVMIAVVVGVFHGELFLVEEGCAAAFPLVARSRWAIDYTYAPEVVGLTALAPWSDAFCNNSNRFHASGLDALYEDDTVLVVYSECDGGTIGLDTSRRVEHINPAWKSGMTIMRQDRVISVADADGTVHHRGDGPEATVLGVYEGRVYISFRSDYGATVGRSSVTSGLLKASPVEPHEYPKWRPCPSWENHVQTTFLSPEETCHSDNFETRLQLVPPPSPTYAFWWGFVKPPKEESPTPAAASLIASEPSSAFRATDEPGTTPSVAAPLSPPSAPAQATQLILFDRTATQCLEKLFEEHGGKTGSYYDSDGGSYFIESMTYRWDDPLAERGKGKQEGSHKDNDDQEEEEVYTMVREAVESVDSYCQFAFRLYLLRDFPKIHDALVERAVVVLRETMHAEARQVAERRRVETVFLRGEINVLRNVCSIAPMMVLAELERVAAALPPETCREITFRYSSTPERVRRRVVLWVLQLLGLQYDTVAVLPLPQLLLLLAAMEHVRGIVTDVPSMEEYVTYLQEVMQVLFDEESIERRKLIQEERNWWLKHLPLTGRRYTRRPKDVSVVCTGSYFGKDGDEPLDLYEELSVRVMRSNLSVAHKKFHALMANKTAQNVRCALQLPSAYSFTLQDASNIRFQPSCMSFQRGDVIEYTLGDVKGTRATVLGMYNGLLWRYETSGGYYHNKALPFAGTEADIKERYGPVVVMRGAEDTLAKLRGLHAAPIRDSNVIQALCYDGMLRTFDPSSVLIRKKYHVLAGDRLMVTAGTPLDVFPFVNLVIVVVGVCDDRLWFAVDHTGLLPFPPDTTDVMATYHLRRVCHGPVVFPSLETPNPFLLPVQGVVGPEEGAVSGKTGPMTLLFATSPKLLGSTSHASKIMFTSGDNRGRRCAVVGYRHGKVWVLWEHEAAARALHVPLALQDFKILPPDTPGGFRSIESTTLLTTLPTVRIPRDEPWFRFPTQRGGLACFLTNCQEQFGVDWAREVNYSVAKKQKLPSKKGVIVGVREGTLWKVDTFDSIAKPFIGAHDAATLQKKFDIVLGDVVAVDSHTW